MSENNIGMWYVEHVHGDQWFMKMRVKDVLSNVKQSKFQKIQFFDLASVGKTLVLDGLIQSCENDEKIYHELLVHPAMFFHPNPKKVFIGGGGEGGTAREVLKHKTVEQCIMVDIDGDCVELCRKFLPEFSNGAFEDRRMDLKIDDAKKLLEESKDGEYDVIILDLADPQEEGPCFQLYTKEFYEMCKSKLNDDGVLVTQSTSADFFCCTEAFSKIHNTFKEVFEVVKPYSIHVPSFSGDWGFNIGLKNVGNKDLLNDDAKVDELIESRIIGGEKSLEVYDGETSGKSFRFTKCIRKKLSEETVVITKDRLVFFH